MRITAIRATGRELWQPLDPGPSTASTPCACARLDAARTSLARATAAAAMEREQRRRLEHTLHEELGQELAGIAFTLGAVRRSPDDRIVACDTRLQEIADLLGAAIARCARVAAGS